MKTKREDNFRVREYLVDSDRVVFVFTGMGTRIGLYRLFVRAMNKRGYSVVIYDYPPRMVWKAEFEVFDLLYEGIKIDVDARIEKLKPKRIYAFGISMGTVIAARLTRNMPAIKHLIMSLTYGDIVTNTLHSWMNAPTRKHMKRKGLTVEDLTKAVQHYDSIKNAAGLKDKKVWLHLARKDSILNYKITVKTKEALEKNIKDFTYTEDKRRGHFIAGAKFLRNTEAIDKFYKS